MSANKMTPEQIINIMREGSGYIEVEPFGESELYVLYIYSLSTCSYKAKYLIGRANFSKLLQDGIIKHIGGCRCELVKRKEST